MNIERTRSQRPLIPLLVLSLCLLLISINGFIGGYLMLADPNGAPMGIPVSYLEDTLFVDFTIPGIALITIWGFGSLITLIGLWWRPPVPLFITLTQWTHQHWAWVFTLLMGIGLFIWLSYQAFTLPEMAVIQYILYVFSLLMIGLPLIPTMRHAFQIGE